MDGDAADAFGEPAFDLRPVGFDSGNRAARPTGLANGRTDRSVIRQCRLRRQPTLLSSQRPERGHLRPSHQSRAGNVAIGIALAQPDQDLTILKHLESPSAHWPLPQAKSCRVAADVSSRCPSSPYKVAPLCRSASGSIMAITPWLHYADHPLAPICRSRSGSNMPVGDRFRATWVLGGQDGSRGFVTSASGPEADVDPDPSVRHHPTVRRMRASHCRAVMPA